MTGYSSAAAAVAKASSGPAVACIAPSVCAAAAAISRSTASNFAGADDDDVTLSVIVFIILYGFVPRNDLGKYWSSTEGVYSGIAAAGAVVGDDVVSSANIGVS